MTSDARNKIGVGLPERHARLWRRAVRRR